MTLDFPKCFTGLFKPESLKVGIFFGAPIFIAAQYSQYFPKDNSFIFIGSAKGHFHPCFHIF